VVSFPQVSPSKPCMHLCYLPHVLHSPPVIILFYLIIRIIFVEEYRSQSSSLCSLLHSPVSSSLLGPDVFLEHLILQHPKPSHTDSVMMYTTHTHTWRYGTMLLWHVAVSTAAKRAHIVRSVCQREAVQSDGHSVKRKNLFLLHIIIVTCYWTVKGK
jgi:hypothetical protein